MPKVIDLSGKRFTRLQVIGLSHIDKSHNAVWKCVCDCGTERTIRGVSLREGRTKSCGCYSKQLHSGNKYKRLEYGQAAFNALYASYKKGAKKRDLEFEITKAQFKEITTKNCYFCNREPEQGKGKNPLAYGDFIHNGIDRKENHKGYTLENSIPCCIRCNWAKGTLSKDEFLTMVVRIYNNLT